MFICVQSQFRFICFSENHHNCIVSRNCNKHNCELLVWLSIENGFNFTFTWQSKAVFFFRSSKSHSAGMAFTGKATTERIAYYKKITCLWLFTTVLLSLIHVSHVGIFTMFYAESAAATGHFQKNTQPYMQINDQHLLFDTFFLVSSFEWHYLAGQTVSRNHFRKVFNGLKFDTKTCTFSNILKINQTKRNGKKNGQQS